MNFCNCLSICLKAALQCTAWYLPYLPGICPVLGTQLIQIFLIRKTRLDFTVGVSARGETNPVEDNFEHRHLHPHKLHNLDFITTIYKSKINSYYCFAAGVPGGTNPLEDNFLAELAPPPLALINNCARKTSRIFVYNCERARDGQKMMR